MTTLAYAEIPLEVLQSDYQHDRILIDTALDCLGNRDIDTAVDVLKRARHIVDATVPQ